jgi:hypothetical protein
VFSFLARTFAFCALLTRLDTVCYAYRGEALDI